MSSLQAAFYKRLRKAGATPPAFERKHPFATGTVPRPRPKPQPSKPVFGGSVGDVEREHEHTYGTLPPTNPQAGAHKNVKAAVMKALEGV